MKILGKTESSAQVHQFNDVSNTS